MYNTNLSLTLNLSSCTNRCKHCWAEASPERGFMSLEVIQGLIPQIVEARAKFQEFFPFFFYEPSIHPHFLTILELFHQHKLWPKDYFMPTNGFGFATFNEDDWQRFKAIPATALQFCLYGDELEHDSFAGRKGAYQALREAMFKGIAAGVEILPTIVMHGENLHFYKELETSLKQEEPRFNFGGFPFLYGGAAKKLKPITADKLKEYPELSYIGKFFKSEKSLVEEVLANPEYQTKPATCSCEGVRFVIDNDLSVYCGSACDSGGVVSVLPTTYKSHFCIGSLKNDSLLTIIERFMSNPPKAIKLLEDLTYHDLALKYGKSSDNLYYMSNLFEVKYAAEYLKENLA